ncbi:50S ribosomal protein L11 methyltransferase [Thermodesulfobacteriota bacterium]
MRRYNDFVDTLLLCGGVVHCHGITGLHTLKTGKYQREGFCAGPYEDLYIYYLEGRVSDRDEQTLGNFFLGNWIEDNFSFLFFSAASKDIVTELLKMRPDLELIDDYQFTYEQWQGGGLASVKIENILIVPPWEEIEPDTGEIKIIMDPGVVFGTGLHPTTRDCLKAMISLKKQYPFEKVMDLGTGTGILAIAAASLGVKEVLAVDLNPLSVKTAKNNVSLNGFEKAISVVKGKAEDFVAETADLIVANLHYDVIRGLLEEKGFLEKKYFIISGLMRSQAGYIKDRMGKYNLILLNEWDHEMTWYTLLARRG